MVIYILLQTTWSTELILNVFMQCHRRMRSKSNRAKSSRVESVYGFVNRETGWETKEPNRLFLVILSFPFWNFVRQFYNLTLYKTAHKQSVFHFSSGDFQLWKRWEKAVWKCTKTRTNEIWTKKTKTIESFIFFMYTVMPFRNFSAKIQINEKEKQNVMYSVEKIVQVKIHA